MPCTTKNNCTLCSRMLQKAFDVVNHVELADTLNHLVNDPQLAQAVHTECDKEGHFLHHYTRSTSTPSCSATHCDPDTFEQYCHQQKQSMEILLKRQCALRVQNSWAMNAQDTIDIYDMGSIDDIFESDNPHLLKKHFKQAIRKEWNRRLKEECAGKSSLRWLHLPPDEPLHIIWCDMNCQSHTRKATIKARMTTGVTSYRLM